MGEPFAGSPIAFNQGSGCKIRKKFALPKVRQIKKTPTGVFFIWWTRRDSNPRPPRCERGALPTEPRAHLCADLKFRSPIIARLPGGVKQKPPPQLPRRELFLRGNINW